MKNFYKLLLIVFIILFAASCNKDDLLESIDTGTFTDSRDGNRYKWVKIGNQIWMVENLAYLPEVSPSSQGSTTNSHYYVYGYDGTSVSSAKASENYHRYGVLYNFSATMRGAKTTEANPSNVQGISPEGWHIPSHEEWEQLAHYISDQYGPYEIWENSWEGVGIHLKSTGNIEDKTGYWKKADVSFLGLDDYGFNALPSGFRDYSYKEFMGIEYSCSWWSCTGNYSNLMWHRMLNFERTDFFSSYANKAYGYSVRCVKD